MRVCGLVTCAVALVSLTGCPSYSTMGLARPLRKGALQTVVSPEAQGGVGGGVVGWPQVEFGVHYGVTDSFELGAKIWILGAALETKFGLVESPTMDSGVDMSLAPSLAYSGIGLGFGGVNIITLSVPLLVGINFGGNQLVLGPKLVDHLLIAAGAGNVMLGGLSIGYAFKVSNSFRVVPEVTAMYPLVAQAGSDIGFAGIPGVILQLGVGFIFGGEYESPRESLPP